MPLTEVASDPSAALCWRSLVAVPPRRSSCSTRITPDSTARRTLPPAAVSMARSAANATAGTATRFPASTCAAACSAAPITNDDLASVITTGTPAGMPPFKLQPAELTGIVAFIRARFDTTASVRVGDAVARARHLRGQGHVRRLPSGERPRAARGAGPERHRDRAHAGGARAIAPRPVVGDAADQPSRPHRDEGRQDHPRTPPQRGHVHGADHRRGGAAAVDCEARRARSSRSTRSRRCRPTPIA